MLITVSGPVGSGKSTVAAQVVRAAAAAGVNVTCQRFQSLACFGPFRSTHLSASRTSSRSEPKSPSPRWAGYRRKRLTAPRTAVYLARILSFRIYRRLRLTDGAYVLNRYFYDLLPHYRLDSHPERAYAGLLRWATPKPDLAILMVASPSSLKKRRTNYSEEYLEETAVGYRGLPMLYPDLVVVPSDEGAPTVEAVGALTQKLFGGSRPGVT